MSKSSKFEKKAKEDEFKSVLVSVNRVSKVVKGGRRFGFSVLVVVGNQKGQVGYGLGKAKEVMEAKVKADQVARKNMISINLKEKRTIHHDVQAKSGAGIVLLKTAPSGKGIIAGGPMRAIFECLGVHDIVSKCLGSTNPHNMIAATFEALKMLSSPKDVALRRGKKIVEVAEDIRK